MSKQPECRTDVRWMSEDEGDEDTPFELTAYNAKLDEEHTIELSLNELRRLSLDSISMCSGPCECSVEPDAWCQEGWWSIPCVAGLI